MADRALARQAQPDRRLGRIPSRSPTVRRHTRELFAACPWLARPDLAAVVRYCDLAQRYRKLAELLDKLAERSEFAGVITAQGEPRKALAELRALAGELLKHEAALGLTAAHRAALGVGLGKMADLAQMMSEAPDGER